MLFVSWSSLFVCFLLRRSLCVVVYCSGMSVACCLWFVVVGLMCVVGCLVVGVRCVLFVVCCVCVVCCCLLLLVADCCMTAVVAG